MISSNFRLLFFLIYYLFNFAVYGFENALLVLPIFIPILLGVCNIKVRAFCLLDMFYLVSFLFFVISPMQTIIGNRMDPTSPLSLYYVSFDTKVEVVTIFTLFFTAFYMLQRKYKIFDNSFSHLFDSFIFTDKQVVRNFLVLFIVLISSTIIYVFLKGGLVNVLAPRFEKDSSLSNPIGLAFLAISMTCFFHIVATYRMNLASGKLLLPLLALSFCLMLVLCNPTNSPRFMIVACWVPVFFILVVGRVSAVSFYLVVLLSIVFILPILSLTTRTGLEGLSFIDQRNFLAGFLKLPYIDVFDTGIYAIDYLKRNGHSLGENLVLMMGFFIPRSIWLSKPDLFSLSIGEELYASGSAGTPNLSMTYIIELYGDFYYLGVLLASILTFLFFYLLIRNTARLRFIVILQLCFLGALPILIRGPAPAVSGLFFCQFFSMFLIQFLLVKKKF